MLTARLSVRSAVTVLAAVVSASTLAAQQLPPPGQSQQALQQAIAQQPGLGGVLRSRIAESGLTPDQVRARLRASGYPANLLDSYLGPAAPGHQAPAPGANELAAIQALGLAPITVQATLPVDTGFVRAVRAESAAAALPGELRIFGADVFRRTTTQFLPTLSGPVPADYRLGPGDVLVLILTGDVELAHSLTVTREGFVLIPQVGQVPVANLTLEQLRSTLYTRLGRVYSGVTRSASATTRFDITVANVRAVQVYVVGEVAQPGAYQISSLGTVLTALYAAGGVTNGANTRRVEVRRAGRSAAEFDLYDYLLRGDTRNDIRLETGDVVFVPVHGTRAAVRGAVLRPAIYELKASETLTDLILAAGGFRADAVRRRLSIERIVPPAQRRPDAPPRVVIEVPAAGDSTVPPLALADGDIVTVDSLPLRAVRNFVEIRGSVYQPGRYGLEPGMTLSRLVALAGGFRPATYAGRAHIERLGEADSTRSMVPVTLPRDSGTAWSDDPSLREYDIVTIYGRPEMRDSIQVAIAGMVTRPGRFLWREGMTLRDLVLMARGPRVGASLLEAEIARLPLDRTQGQMATTIRVPLDSTYLFDRDSLGRYIGPPGLPFPPSGAPDVVLEPYDNVLILRQPDFELQRSIEILGEVRYPGTYALRMKDERLADLVERVGGLTPRAYPEGIRFVRAVGAAGRINIDLPRAMRDRESRDNIILQPGDSIHIPEYAPSVRVAGAVNSPGSVLWQRGKPLSYYIDAAGGTARLAVGSRASVRQPDGEVETRRRVLLLFRDDPEPGPGSDVFVPARSPDEPRSDWGQMVTTSMAFMASLLSILVLAKEL
jgi:protein involved in polysaccharide export with SLBB domain